MARGVDEAFPGISRASEQPLKDLRELIIPQYLYCIVMNTLPMARVYILNIFQILDWTRRTHTLGYLDRVSLQRKGCHTNIWREWIFKGQLCFEAWGNKPGLISASISFSLHLSKFSGWLSVIVLDWSHGRHNYLRLWLFVSFGRFKVPHIEQRTVFDFTGLYCHFKGIERTFEIRFFCNAALLLTSSSVLAARTSVSHPLPDS